MNVGGQKNEHGAKFYLNRRSTNNANRKRGSEIHVYNESDSLMTEASPRKRRAIQSFRKLGANAKLPFPMLAEVDTFPFPSKNEGEDCVCLSSFKEMERVTQSVEEAQSRHSSVASSSSYLYNSHLHSDRKSSNQQPVDNSPIDEAQSFCESVNRRKAKPLTVKDMADKIHKLELHAYHKMVRAFFASGCLTWEREALLTHLRLSLHISHDEHLSELACLCPVQSV